MKYLFAGLILLLSTLLRFGYSQESSIHELEYEINKIYPPLSITKEKLNDAQTLADINPNYKPAWVREYFSVEILTSDNGMKRKAVGKNDTLSQEQKDVINSADEGAPIAVKVHYMPENTLKDNEAKEIDFELPVSPDNDAKYPGGQQKLKDYLKDKAISQIPDDVFKGFDLAAIKFTVDEQGHIMDAHVFWSSDNKKIDDLLLKTVCNMPDWIPAEYANGYRVKQEFAFTVGNMESCVIPMLNIREQN